MYDIENLFLFCGLNEGDKKEVISSLTDTVSFERGDVIYDREHFRKAVGIFLSGKGIAKDANVAKAGFACGDIFGAAAIFGAGEEYVSRIEAKTACKVLFISEDTLMRLFEKHPVCAINFVRFLSDKIRYLNGKIAQYTENGAASKLYRLLCDKADEEGCVTDANMSLLAALIGMGRTSVYRAISELEEKNMIIRKDKKIYINK